jgi:hypothetical protein
MRGVSSKSCKGVWQSLINLGRCRVWDAAAGTPRHFLSEAHLTCLAAIAVQQDLALVALPGLTHIERNGLHFVDSFSGRPRAEALRFLAAHPDLYADTPRGPHLSIREGMVDIAPLDVIGFGAMEEPDIAAMAAMPKAAWPQAAA